MCVSVFGFFTPFLFSSLASPALSGRVSVVFLLAASSLRPPPLLREPSSAVRPGGSAQLFTRSPPPVRAARLTAPPEGGLGPLGGLALGKICLSDS